MIRLAPLIAALVFLSQEGFPTRTISVTPEPAPVGVEEVATDIKADEWYILAYDDPKSILASPEGVVSVTEYAGPMAFRGRFPGGSQIETRVFQAPHLYSIEAVSKGAVEILVLPKGTEVIRQVVTVDGGNGPRPPPDPGQTDVLTESHEADRKSQVDILRQLAAKNLPRDAAGLTAAKDFVNAERIRRRTEDFIPLTDAIGEAIFSGTVTELADQLEGKP